MTSARSVVIRRETAADRPLVEAVTRKAFYNIYTPGCVEHYLVHIMRQHNDFIPELALVLEVDGQLVGNIMYTKAHLVDEAGTEKPILTFGPVSILPDYQRKGYGRQLMNASFDRAVELGHEVIVIFGDPDNYVGRGFKSCLKYHISLDDGTYPAAMLVKELVPGALDGRKWHYHQSPVMQIDEAEAQRYDDSLEKMTKTYQASQEAFYIHSHAFLKED